MALSYSAAAAKSNPNCVAPHISFDKYKLEMAGRLALLDRAGDPYYVFPVFLSAPITSERPGGSAMAARNRRLGFVAIPVALFTIFFIVNRRQKLAAETADLILVNGKIVTVDDRFPAATWIALRGDRISAVGSDPKGYNLHVGDGTEIIDLGGALAIPGLVESHGHFTGLGQSKTVLDL